MMFFMEIDGKSPFDLVAHKDGKLLRVEVKSTTQRTRNNSGWMVELKSVRSNKTINKIYNFSKDRCDILIVFIEPINKVLLFNSSEISTTSAMTISDKSIL